ncbi:hypothetical protein CC78DRAFT_581506 [Lojkania enalia]|uniref:C2H2-type domain-containing protein n=1 Tax=Lojkania enalia TaxID=147567 RepID=A0A9P4MZ85_9PLEO|nr:hypothetical protein CC78DRAFT_581506 [Didymosphaeria enalia]
MTCQLGADDRHTSVSSKSKGSWANESDIGCRQPPNIPSFNPQSARGHFASLHAGPLIAIPPKHPQLGALQQQQQRAAAVPGSAAHRRRRLQDRRWSLSAGQSIELRGRTWVPSVTVLVALLSNLQHAPNRAPHTGGPRRCLTHPPGNGLVTAGHLLADDGASSSSQSARRLVLPRPAPRSWCSTISSACTRPLEHPLSGSVTQLPLSRPAVYCCSASVTVTQPVVTRGPSSMAMHLASMVHGSGREREAHDQHRHFQHHHPYPASYYPPQSQPRGFAVLPHAGASPYPAHQQAVEYQYQRHPQSPPSPPVEEQKPSLPSISSLLGIADAEKGTSETGTCPPSASRLSRQQQQQHRQHRQQCTNSPVAAAAGQSQSPKSQRQPSPQIGHEVHQRGAPAQHFQQPESRPDQATHSYSPTIVSHPRMTLPPTPPMHPDQVVDGNQSPSAASSHSQVSASPYFLGSSLNNMEPHQQRQNAAVPPVKRSSIPSQPPMSPFNASTYTQSPYASSPGAASTGSYYSPETQAYSSVGMYGQRPLPSNYQPQTMPLPTPTSSANGSNVWQHHHYISTSSQSAFPQSQDRYICSTCNKAFSRPSSLRIHSHSHTGEKPYKCPQPGCGKAFSVRSNMKRHERGCHASTSATITTT